MSGLMHGKRVLVVGARTKWSLAWGAASALHREGATLAFSVFGDREEKGVRKLMEDAGITGSIFQCDAGEESQIESLLHQTSKLFDGQLDGLVHGIAFANKEELSGEFIATSREGFTLAHDRSVYTLVSMARAARPLMRAAGGGSIVTLTYIGSERVVPNYNVMGVAKASLEASVRYLAADLGPEAIRVNAVSAGPVKTMAASAIANIDLMMQNVVERSPLRRSTKTEEVGDSVMFLLSSLARGITGEVLHVDSGYHIIGMV